MITPTPGRVLWVFSNGNQYDATGKAFSISDPDQPLAAIVAFVHSETVVNVAAFDHLGRACRFSSIPIIDQCEDKPETGVYACWMPCQLGQAQRAAEAEARAEAAERRLTRMIKEAAIQLLESGGTLPDEYVEGDEGEHSGGA